MKPFKQFGGEVPIPNNKASSLLLFIQQQLSNLYSTDEIREIAFILLQHYAGIQRLDYYKNPDQLVNQSVLMNVHGALDLLKQGMPVQQVVGWCAFYHHRFYVNQHVLIPRPETEELVDQIIKSNLPANPTILDIGTGSGCIAISLKKAIPKAQVWAMEVSPEALQVANRNAHELDADVQFLNADLFSFDQWNELPEYDILVSNPPYISLNEKHTLAARVEAFEPHIALFAPGSDPLIFYRKIAEIGRLKLKTEGQIWVEINERLGEETKQVFVDAGYSRVQLLTDLNGKHRFVKAML
jgi:release factor glutamine methyltransferase